MENPREKTLGNGMDLEFMWRFPMRIAFVGLCMVPRRFPTSGI